MKLSQLCVGALLLGASVSWGSVIHLDLYVDGTFQVEWGGHGITPVIPIASGAGEFHYAAEIQGIGQRDGAPLRVKVAFTDPARGFIAQAWIDNTGETFEDSFLIVRGIGHKIGNTGWVTWNAAEGTVTDLNRSVPAGFLNPIPRWLVSPVNQTSFSVGVSSAIVPEPSTCAAMAVMLAGLGFALRRR